MTQILFTAFEAEPFIKTGGLGDVAGSLPYYIKSEDYDIRVILPKLNSIPAKFQEKMEFITNYNVELGWRNQYCGLFKLESTGMTFYFLDNEYYFHREKIYGEFDDGERVAFFAKAVLETIRYIDGFEPKLIHCNDWHTALVPVFLKELYAQDPLYAEIKTVFTIHNLKFQGEYDPFMIGDVLGLHNTPAAKKLLNAGRLNYLKGACVYCDLITTVSPSYANEICTGYYGEGLDWLFNERKDSLVGILNGIDYNKYNPATDPAIKESYTSTKLSGKNACKAALQKKLGLKVDKNVPLFAIVSRLTEQKGLDLVNYMLPEFIRRDMQLAILGVGAPEYEEAFAYYAGLYPEKVAACLHFDEALSKEFFSGADVLMMPSRFEPCGLSQMMSMRYGTLPLVRETGGLRDSVKPYNKFTGEGTGFSFSNFNAHELLTAVDIALEAYSDKTVWRKLRKTAMNEDFSWTQSALEYRCIYQELL